MPQYLSPGVYVEEVPGGARPIEGGATAVAAFVGLAQSGPFNKPTLVTNWTQFVNTFGDFMEGYYLAHSVYSYFMNGGGIAYVVRIGGSDSGGGQAELTAGANAKLGGFKVQSLEAGPAGNDVSVEVTNPPEGSPDDSFTLVVKKGGKEVESFPGVTAKKGKDYVVTKVNAQSKTIKLDEATTGGALEKPANGTVSLAGGGAAPTPSRLTPDDYVGDAADRTGFGGLEAIDEVTMVCVPDLMAAYNQGLIDLDGVKAVQLGMIAHCENMRYRMAIIDPPPGLNAQQVKDWRVEQAGYDSANAALYWPWVTVFDPASGQNISVPPSGAMAGVWARNDNSRGVHKAPANEVVRGAIDIEVNITKGEADLLNPIGVNAIRAFPGRGIRIWGARTLASDPAWKYINVRRLFNYIEKSIEDNTDWAVFEPNDPTLWGALKRTISGFLVMEWRKGALFGTTPDEAFYVKCDDETNPAEAIDLGQVTVEIGIAPVKPAEFVIFRVAQLQGGKSLAE